MATEIERKFLVSEGPWRQADARTFRQGYLSTDKERTVRVRTIDDKAYLTIKGISVGATRREYEYEIPLQDANELLDNLCERPLIEKQRYTLDHAGLTWEVDVFFGENDGLIIAEVELEHENQAFEKPRWVGKEVTADPRYYNANLISMPYYTWSH
ncbi:MAG: CYTH domain-containing protein [Gammaproteobacteria bacterium]|jgi:CYTH domain-containing protein